MKFLNASGSDRRAAIACRMQEEAVITGRSQRENGGFCSQLWRSGLSVPHFHCTDMHTEATAQFAASCMALGYKLLSVTALHKNGASQFGILMRILGVKAGDVAATVPAALLPSFGGPDLPAQRTTGRDHRWELKGAFSLFPFARTTWVWLPPMQQKRQKFCFGLNTVRQYPLIHHWLQLLL